MVEGTAEYAFFYRSDSSDDDNANLSDFEMDDDDDDEEEFVNVCCVSNDVTSGVTSDVTSSTVSGRESRSSNNASVMKLAVCLDGSTNVGENLNGNNSGYRIDSGNGPTSSQLQGGIAILGGSDCSDAPSLSNRTIGIDDNSYDGDADGDCTTGTSTCFTALSALPAPLIPHTSDFWVSWVCNWVGE